MLLEAIQKAPDPYERLPLVNRPETVYGWTVTFLVRPVVPSDQTLFTDYSGRS